MQWSKIVSKMWISFHKEVSDVSYSWVQDEMGKNRRESLKSIKYILVAEQRKYWVTNDWILKEFLGKDIFSWSVVMYLLQLLETSLLS